MKTTHTVVRGPAARSAVEYLDDGLRSSSGARQNSRGHSDIAGGGGRRCAAGWGSRYGGREPKRSSELSMKLEGKSYDEIKAQCLRENRLFHDLDFPPNDSSICPSSRRSSQAYQWKRPGVSHFHTNSLRRNFCQ